MEIILTLIPVVCVLITIGAIFALPFYVPVLKNMARHTASHRQTTITIMAVFTLVFCVGGISYLDVLVTNSFSGTISGVENPFITNSEQDNALVLEMWLQNVVPPSLRADCYSKDVAICAVAQDIEASLHMNTKMEYLLLMAHGFIAMMANILLLNHILHDDRKKKVPTLVTG